MTPEQMAQFIRVMQFGAAVGIHNRFEVLQRFITYYPNEKRQTIFSFAAFERGCGMSEEASLALEEMTDEEFYQYVKDYCRQTA